MIVKCPHCSAMLECEQEPGSTVDCAGCGQSFEANPMPKIKTHPSLSDIQNRAANAGLNKSVGELPPPHLRGIKPWQDDGRWFFLLFMFGIVIPVFLAIVEEEFSAYACASLAWGAMIIWGFGLLRACAHRLRHIEELLARRP